MKPRDDLSRSGAAPPLLEVEGLAKRFAVGGGFPWRPRAPLHAVDDVSFTLGSAETLGIVGESGCGKSTLARMIVRLVEPSAGTIRFRGTDLTSLSGREMRAFRRDIQFVFQDPYASLNPRLRAGDIVGEAIENYESAARGEVRDRVAALFERVGLRTGLMDSFPHQFSGGQRQRLGIARALSLGPQIVIADEPVSALDVSVQAQVINLLIDLQDELGLAYLFIAHDLAVVQHISHRVAVMYLGRIVELAPQRTLFCAPLHPYTEALLDAVPAPDPSRRTETVPLSGEVPSPAHRPAGCHFHPRCPLAEERCRIEAPALVEAQPGHFAACHVRAPAEGPQTNRVEDTR